MSASMEDRVKFVFVLTHFKKLIESLVIDLILWWFQKDWQKLTYFMYVMS